MAMQLSLLADPEDAAVPRRISRPGLRLGHWSGWLEASGALLPALQAEKSGGKGSNPKLDWMNRLTGHPLGVASELQEMTTRLIRLSLQQGGLSLVFRTDSRFVTGLGRTHPVENGFAWHPTLGTPYLPGSSIKGMVRAWAVTEARPCPDEMTLSRMFGAPGQSSCFCFFDAVPMAPARVEADVITPHYAAWSPDDPPGDWRSPVPVPFLVTAGGLELLFTVLPCGPMTAGDLEQVEFWLIEALAWAGAGAKTAVGYGRMTLNRQKSRELLEAEQQRQKLKQDDQRKAEHLASLDPLDRELEELAAAQPGIAPYRTWIKAVQGDRWRDQPTSNSQVLERIVSAMQRDGKWREHSHKRNPEKDKEFILTKTVKDLIAQARTSP